MVGLPSGPSSDQDLEHARDHADEEVHDPRLKVAQQPLRLGQQGTRALLALCVDSADTVELNLQLHDLGLKLPHPVRMHIRTEQSDRRSNTREERHGSKLILRQKTTAAHTDVQI
eukprot:EC716603.1.p1 GENE.EC716603.1~~EC716603.1.p1  ORF type:complete len:115 (-),score=16.37 EC716603.1:99-443(-)